MAWETRGNGRYYYQKRRIGQQVISEYIGSGEVATAIAYLNEMAKEEQDFERWQREQVQKELGKDREIDRQLDEVVDMVRHVKTAVLLINGFHTHKRQWRRYVSE